MNINRRIKYFYSITTALIMISLMFSEVYSMEAVDGEYGKLLRLQEDLHPESLLVTGKTVRDPFNWAPQVVEEYQKKFTKAVENVFNNLKLTGIIWGKENPMAIINGVLLRQGEIIDGVDVLEIGKNSVLLRKGEQQHILNFEDAIFEYGQ